MTMQIAGAKQILTLLGSVDWKTLLVTSANILDEDGAERPQLPQTVMDWSSWPDTELTTLEAVDD